MAKADYEYKYLTSEQVQQIILSSLYVRPMTEDELCDVVIWADNVARYFGVLENVLCGNFGLEPIGERGIKAHLLQSADGNVNHGSIAEKIFGDGNLSQKDTLDLKS